jgi:hypothetical protein
MASEAGPEEREAELRRLFRRMGRAARREDAAGLERLSVEYAALKAAHVAESHAEARAEVRARRAAARASEGQERRPWRLPRGFASPLAAELARLPVAAPAPQVPAGGHLRPWRGGHPASAVIWRP